MDTYTSEFIDFVNLHVKQNSHYIFSIQYEGKKYWIKKARATYASKIHKFFYKFLPFELLIIGEKKTPHEALRYEINKLKNMQKNGLKVPSIVYESDDFVVLLDVGESLYELLEKDDLTQEEFYKYTCKSLDELCKLHNKNFFHGASQARNFTIKDDEIYMVDFKESFDKNISLETLQFRDFLLYLLSFAKIKKTFVDFSFIIDNYIKLTNQTDTKIKLINLIKFLNPLVKICHFKPIDKILGSDVKNFIILVQQVGKNEI